MKKILYTLSFVALVSFAANAQDDKPVKKEHPKTAKEEGTATLPAEKKEETKKPGGTRMAINEKGTSGGIKPKNTGKNEDKKNENPATQPGPGKKD